MYFAKSFKDSNYAIKFKDPNRKHVIAKFVLDCWGANLFKQGGRIDGIYDIKIKNKKIKVSIENVKAFYNTVTEPKVWHSLSVRSNQDDYQKCIDDDVKRTNVSILGSDKDWDF